MRFLSRCLAFRGRPGRSRRGQGLTEYGLIIMLVAISCYLSTSSLGLEISDVITDSGDAIDNASSGVGGTPDLP